MTEKQGAGLLGRADIAGLLETRELVIEPQLEIPGAAPNPASIDLRLDNAFVEFRTGQETHLDPLRPTADYARRAVVEYDDERGYALHPGKLVLAQSFEWLHLPASLMGYLEGRSSMGRYGLVVHATAGWVDPGFTGHLTFELVNTGEMPVKLYPLMRIARMVFFRCQAETSYAGQFRFQTRPKVPPAVDVDLVTIRERLERAGEGEG